MWQQYRQNIQVTSPAQLDAEVARRAFADGMSRKAIALMLSAESPWVKQLVRRSGKGSAIAYVNRTVQKSCLPPLERKQTQLQKRQLEL